MTTVTFWANAPQAFLGGIKGDAGVFSNIVDQHRFTYAAYRPPAIVSYLGPSDGGGGIVTATSYVDAARFYYPGNTDNRELTFTLEAEASGGTGTIQATVDGTDTGTVSVTSAGSYSISITPTTSTDPSEVLVEAKVTAGAMSITGMRAQARQADGALGTAASGWSYADMTTYTDTGTMHASERWHRLINGPRAIAADRRACVVNVCDMIGGSSGRSPYASSSTKLTTISRFRFAGVDAGVRDYLVAAYFEADGGVSFTGSVKIASKTLSISSTGWTTGTFSLPSSAEEGAVRVRVTGGTGHVYLRTLQVIRKV